MISCSPFYCSLFSVGRGGAGVSGWGGLLLVFSATSRGKGTTAPASLADFCELPTSLGPVCILATVCIFSLRGFFAFLLSWSFLPTAPFFFFSGEWCCGESALMYSGGP